MTWSPRNRPGEDDDDIGAPDESGDRPTSSLSDGSDLGIDGSTLLPQGITMDPIIVYLITVIKKLLFQMQRENTKPRVLRKLIIMKNMNLD